MYRFIECDRAVDEKILEVNGLNRSDLLIDDFIVNTDQKCIQDFKKKILEFKDENFFIVGDYDYDGISAVTIISRLFARLGIRHNFYIPSRIKEGYGINTEMVERAKKYDFTVILTLDNGIVAHEAINRAKELGLKFMIVDHHEYNKLPDVDAVVHPSLLEKEYEDACTGGLSCLISKAFIEDDFAVVMAGCATMADMSKVFGYNRYLIQKGLEQLNNGSYSLINMLAKTRTYDYYDLSFNVIPKVNAISRMGYSANMMASYFLKSTKEAMSMVDGIDKVNEERKQCSKEMLKLADKLVNDDEVMVITDESFKEGLCGIAAGRLSDKYMRPVIVLSGDSILKGSGRSYGEFNFYEYLSGCKELFNNFGGHDKAVGLSIEKDKLEKLKEYIKNNPVVIEECSKDVLLIDKDMFNMDTIELMESLEPYGSGFKPILIAVRNKNIDFIDGTYPKFRINDICDAILFDRSKLKDDFNYLIGRLERSRYKKGTLSFVIEDIV